MPYHIARDTFGKCDALFGVRDSWAKNPNLTFHTAVQVEQLLNRDLIVELLREREEDGEALKGPKHWHQFHIIARNRKP